MRTGESENKPGAAEAWRSRVGELAAWTAHRLVNRLDAWGAYRPDHEIGREYPKPDGTTGKLGAQKTVKGQLARSLLLRHFQAPNRSAILGLHSASADNLALWGALDIDWHGPESTSAEINLAAALSWYRELAGRGFHPLLTSSNGKGGYHLRVLLATPIPADRLFHFLKSLIANHRQLGLPAAPEHFPKQVDVRRCKKELGNWLRCIGKHYRYDHWSEVWSGVAWLSGAEAVDFILALEGDSPALVPDLPPPAVTPPTQGRSAFHQRANSSSGRGNLSARIAAYASRLPHLQEGQGRTRVAFSFAAWLVRDLALADDVALTWLKRWNSSNSPPLSSERLKEILADAHAYGTSAYGCGLAPEKPRRDRHGHRILSCELEV